MWDRTYRSFTNSSNTHCIGNFDSKFKNVEKEVIC